MACHRVNAEDIEELTEVSRVDGTVMKGMAHTTVNKYYSCIFMIIQSPRGGVAALLEYLAPRELVLLNLRPSGRVHLLNPLAPREQLLLALRLRGRVLLVGKFFYGVHTKYKIRWLTSHNQFL
jgi:hypothetical protein